MQLVHFRDLGKMEYGYAWKLQESIFNDIVQKKLKNRVLNDEEQLTYSHQLLFVEHNPVITLGKSANENNVLLNETLLNQNGVSLFHINRGGDVTYHGPGQIVGYPILHLDYLADYGLQGERLPGATGVWLDATNKNARKICAIGIRSSRWVTMHGFAFNVNTDLNNFKLIIPCGIQDKAVTSLEKELGKQIPLDEVKAKLKQHFATVFNCKLI